MLELKNISSGYGNVDVLRHITTTFEKGKITAVIGPNGCGKSTLLKSAFGMLPLKEGTVFLDKTDLVTMSQKEVAKKVAYLAQGKSVPDILVEQMVLHGRFPHLSYPRRYGARDREIAREAMKQMEITHLAEKPMAALSGGMRQNAYIAMALAQETEYILMDEPTTYLDIAHQLHLMDTMKELAECGKAIVVVLHDLMLAMEYADVVTVLQEGSVLMSASPEEVYESGIINQAFGITLKRSKTEHGFIYFYER